MRLLLSLHLGPGNEATVILTPRAWDRGYCYPYTSGLGTRLLLSLHLGPGIEATAIPTPQAWEQGYYYPYTSGLGTRLLLFLHLRPGNEATAIPTSPFFTLVYKESISGNQICGHNTQLACRVDFKHTVR